MKNIVIVCYNLSVMGGAEQVAINMANGLSELYHVHLVSIFQTGDSLPYSINSNVKYYYMFKEEMRLRQAIFAFRKPFQKYVKEANIEVALLIGDYSGIIGLGSKWGAKIKYVFCEHGALMNQWNEKDIRFIRFFNAVFSNKIITLTQSSRESYVHQFHISPHKVDFIYNWIEDDLINKRKEYDIHSRKIISVGRFGTEKGQDLLLQVANIVLPKHKDWIWDVYGDGETKDQIQKKIIKMKLQNQLILKGNDIEVKSKYGQYAFFVLTSYREGLPLVLLEAKASGLPMVSFDVLTGPNEIIREDGVLIPPYDVKQMAEKIEILIKNDTIRKGMSEKTQKYINVFSRRSILKQWDALIKEII